MVEGASHGVSVKVKVSACKRRPLDTEQLLPLFFTPPKLCGPICCKLEAGILRNIRCRSTCAFMTLEAPKLLLVRFCVVLPFSDPTLIATTGDDGKYPEFPL